MRSRMEETAYAKLNLALHVRVREADGYHRIETLFAFAEAGDKLGYSPADELTLAVRGPFAHQLGEPAGNLVLKAAAALRRRFDVAAGAELTLHKRLPVAAGIGGGSADAAAALRLLCRAWRLDPAAPELTEIAAKLGADVPACLASRTVRGEGRGDLLHAVANDLAGASVLLVNPGVPLATASVFAAWNGADRGPLSADSSLAAIVGARNDLEPAAAAMVPAIARLLTALATLKGVILHRMSGSGATCFALFDSQDARDAAAAALAAAHPDWWRLASRLR